MHACLELNNASFYTMLKMCGLCFRIHRPLGTLCYECVIEGPVYSCPNANVQQFFDDY